MNVKYELEEKHSEVESNSLLATCSYLAARVGAESLVSKFADLQKQGGNEDKKELLKQVIEITRHEGFQTSILRPQESEWAGLVEYLPVIAELRNGSYQLVTKLTTDTSGVPAEVTISEGSADGNRLERVLKYPDFRKISTGGFLCFQKIKHRPCLLFNSSKRT